jgi:hypothetical protein
MNNPLGDSLVIEMGDLLPERKIFQKRRTPVAGFQRVLIVRDNDALIGRERTLVPLRNLMGRAPRASDEVLLGILEILKALSLVRLCH